MHIIGNTWQSRGVVHGGAAPWGPWHPQIFEDQLILSESRGLDNANQIIVAPPDFQTFRRPCKEVVIALITTTELLSDLYRRKKIGFHLEHCTALGLSISSKNSLKNSNMFVASICTHI